MRGAAARFLRHEWSFRVWATRSGERVCTRSHDTPTIRAGHGCPTCKAVI